MPARVSRHRVAAGLLGLTQVAHAQWLFGNLYEAVVKVPDLLAQRGESARGCERALSPFATGSPVRYYAAAVPATSPAVLAAAACVRDEPSSRSLLAAAAVCSISGSAVSAYVVRAINMKLFFSDQALSADERARLLRTWYRLNAVRLVAAGGALWAAHRSRSRLIE